MSIKLIQYSASYDRDRRKAQRPPVRKPLLDWYEDTDQDILKVYDMVSEDTDTG